VTSRGAEVDLHLETNGRDHLSMLVTALVADGFVVTQRRET
jgi:hypothetical protein